VGSFYTNSVLSDDLLNQPSLTLETDFSLLPLSTSLFSIDESYEN
jgi:hypothetical protein